MSEDKKIDRENEEPKVDEQDNLDNQEDLNDEEVENPDSLNNPDDVDNPNKSDFDNNNENENQDNQDKKEDDKKDKDEKEGKDAEGEGSEEDGENSKLQDFRDKVGRSLSFKDKANDGDEDLHSDVTSAMGKVQNVVGDYDDIKRRAEERKKKKEEKEKKGKDDDDDVKDGVDDDEDGKDKEKEDEENEENDEEKDAFGGDSKDKDKDKEEDEEQQQEQQQEQQEKEKDDDDGKEKDDNDDHEGGEAGDVDDENGPKMPKMPKLTPAGIALQVISGIAEGGGSPEEKIAGMITACVCCLACALFPIILLILPILALFYWLVPGITNNMAGIETTESADADFEELELAGRNPYFQDDITYQVGIPQEEEKTEDGIFSNENLTYTVDEQYLQMAKILYDQTDVAAQGVQKDWDKMLGSDDYMKYLKKKGTDEPVEENEDEEDSDDVGITMNPKYNGWELEHNIKLVDKVYKEHLEKEKNDPNFKMAPLGYYFDLKTFKDVYKEADLENKIETPDMVQGDGVIIDAPTEERDTTVQYDNGYWSGRLADGPVLEDTRKPIYYHPGDLSVGLPFDPGAYRNGNLGNINIAKPNTNTDYYLRTVPLKLTLFNEDSKNDVVDNEKWAVMPKLGVVYVPGDDEDRPLIPFGTRMYIEDYGYAIATQVDKSLAENEIAAFLPKGNHVNTDTIKRVGIMSEFPWEADPKWELQFDGSSGKNDEIIAKDPPNRGDEVGNLSELPLDLEELEEGMRMASTPLDISKTYFLVEQKETLNIPPDKNNKYEPSKNIEDYNFNPSLSQFNHIKALNEILNLSGQSLLETQIAYLLSAFSTSRGNSSPIGGHVLELKTLLKSHKKGGGLGFFGDDDDDDYTKTISMELVLVKNEATRYVWTKENYYERVRVKVPIPEPIVPEPEAPVEPEKEKNSEKDNKTGQNSPRGPGIEVATIVPEPEAPVDSEEDGKKYKYVYEDRLRTDYEWKPYPYIEYSLKTRVNPYNEGAALKEFFLNKEVRDSFEVLSIRHKRGKTKVYDPSKNSFVSVDKFEDELGLANLVAGDDIKELTPEEAKAEAKRLANYIDPGSRKGKKMIQNIKEYQKLMNYGRGYVNDGSTVELTGDEEDYSQINIKDLLMADPRTGKENGYVVTLTQLEKDFDNLPADEMEKYGYFKDGKGKTGVSKKEAKANYLMEHILLSDYRDWLLVYLYKCEDDCENPNKVVIKDRRLWGKVKNKLQEWFLDEDHEFSYGHESECSYCGEPFVARRMKFTHWVISGVMKFGKDDEKKEEIDEMFRLPRQEHRRSPELDYYEEVRMDDNGDFTTDPYMPHSVASKIEYFAQNSLDTIEVATRLEEFGLSPYDNSDLTGYGGDGSGIIEIAFKYLEEFNANSLSVNTNDPVVGRGRAYFNKRFYGTVNSAPWCAMFVSVCAKDAGLGPEVIAQSAGVAIHQSHAAADGRWQPRGNGYVPKPGDLIVYSFGYTARRFNHIGLVYGTEGNNVLTIEGNTSVQKKGTNGKIERNGDSIGTKSRSMSYSEIEGFISVNYPETAGVGTAGPKNWDPNDFVPGRTYKADYTSYFPYGDRLQGGYHDSIGRWLCPPMQTIAVPRDVKRGTIFLVEGTGTEHDGKLFTATDRGGKIVWKPGNVMRVDILSPDEKSAYAFGKKYGGRITEMKPKEGVLEKPGYEYLYMYRWGGPGCSQKWPHS